MQKNRRINTEAPMQNNITETHTVGLALNVLKLTPLYWLVAGDMFVIFNIQYLYSLNQCPTYSEVNLDTGISITGYHQTVLCDVNHVT